MILKQCCWKAKWGLVWTTLQNNLSHVLFWMSVTNPGQAPSCMCRLVSRAVSFVLEVRFALFTPRQKSPAFPNYLTNWHTLAFLTVVTCKAMHGISEADCTRMRILFRALGKISKFLLGLESGLWSQTARVWILTLPFTSCITLGKVLIGLRISVPHL